MISDDPKTHENTISHGDANKWMLVIQEEWVYKTKVVSNGNFEQYKVRLVIKGF